MVENKWIRREEELRETGEMEYVGKNRVLRKVGDDYELFSKPTINDLRDNVPDLIMERLKGTLYEDKNLLFLKSIEDRNIFYIDAGHWYYDCLAIIVDNIPVAIPVPVITKLYGCTKEELPYNQKVSKDVWTRHFDTFYIARL